VGNFINYSYKDVIGWPVLTTVIGDIERWAELYLDTGQHLGEWDEKMELMSRRYANGDECIADPLLSSCQER
jgi:hypothetical protein